jgi:L-seryl-tRNA(Ser) seleniumtransferase
LGRLPSVDAVLRSAPGALAVAQFGHAQTVAALRAELARLRPAVLAGAAAPEAEAVAAAALAALERAEAPSLRPVFNCTGVVLHTNLGRAVLAEAAVEAATTAMRQPATLEFSLESGGRGERDDHIRALLCELTGAEDAIAVNNNAAALVLVLAALAHGREVVVSRGELIEIGGAFRLPAIMASAGCVLREVGTTNRTHARDYAEAIGPQTAALMKVHTSNYVVQGFACEVAPAEVAGIARAAGIPLLDDLGSGTLVELSRYGLKRERTVQDALRDGADLVTFSGDKLLGGPQAGFILGRRAQVQACARHPLKRAMRLDKIRLAALEATLRLYRNPDTLAQKLPTLRLLTRPAEAIRALCERVAPALARWSGGPAEVVACQGQIGSGALPLETLPSFAVALAGEDALAARLRALPVPVVGRISAGRVLLDLRCVEDEAGFLANFPKHAAAGPQGPQA